MHSINAGVFRVLVLGLSAWLLASATLAQTGQLQVGAAKRNIDPPENLFVNADNASQPAYSNFIGVHDSLYLRAMVLDNGVQKTALVTMDLGKVPGDQDFLDALGSAMQIDQDYLFVAATHNHSAIDVRNDLDHPYYAYLKSQALAALREANANLQPARVGFGEGRAYINTNRDEFIVNGYHMGYAPEGPSDKTVAVVSFTDMQGNPIAVYANYGVHAVTMFRARTREGYPEVTADLPGYTNSYVEERIPGAVAFWTSGAAGDQNPQYMANYNQDAPDVHDTGAAGYAILDVQSRRLGEEIVRVTQSISTTSDQVRLWGARTQVSCPGQQRAQPREPGVPGGGFRAPANVPMVDGDPVSIPLHLLMINDIALAGISAELFSEIGMRIKAESPFENTMVVTVMPPNGAPYIPTDAAFALPAEKAVANPLKPGCAEPAILAAFAELMQAYQQ